MPRPQRVAVRVPASTSNLGPGFDTLGLALNLATTVTAELAETTEITISGEGAALLSRGPDNLVLRRMKELAQICGAALPPLRLHIDNGMPLERGLGASGAASLGGLLAANAIVGAPLDRAAILDLACRLEGHPDNVTPSLLGGCTVSAVADGHVTALHVPFPGELVCALCIPDVRMPTHAARQVMPPTYSRADVVFNVSRAALLVTALATRNLDTLRVAVQDHVHQPYRSTIFPALMPLIEAAHTAGAFGAFLSGAGSTIAALTTHENAPNVAQAMTAAATSYSLDCRTLIATIDDMGATVEENSFV